MNGNGFDNSIKTAEKTYLQHVPKPEGLTESLMQDAAGAIVEGAIRDGLKKVANMSGKIQSFAQNQKSGGNLGAMAQSGMLDDKDPSAADDKTVITDKWKKMSAEDRAAWEDKGKTFTPPQDGWTYFWNTNKAEANNRRQASVGNPTVGQPTLSDIDWNAEAQNNTQLQQYMASNNITADQLKQLMSMVNK